MDREERVSVFDNTIKTSERGSYIAPNGEEITIQDNDRMVNETKFYHRMVNIDFQRIARYDTEIKVVNKDCLLAARDLFMDGLNPTVLNMASFIRPGGGVLNGSGAQEENIFRRTNLYQSLYMFHNVGEDYGIKQRRERYPLNLRFGGIYTPYVTVFRDSEDKDYEYRDDPFSVSVISVSAIKKPNLTSDGKLQETDADILKTKIKQILSIAIEHNHNAIVLSAFGCGAYGTPPNEMARLFDEVLNSEEYKGAFERVIFAILDDGNSFNKHNPQGNLKPFLDRFGG